MHKIVYEWHVYWSFACCLCAALNWPHILTNTAQSQRVATLSSTKSGQLRQSLSTLDGPLNVAARHSCPFTNYRRLKQPHCGNTRESCKDKTLNWIRLEPDFKAPAGRDVLLRDARTVARLKQQWPQGSLILWRIRTETRPINGSSSGEHECWYYRTEKQFCREQCGRTAQGSSLSCVFGLATCSCFLSGVASREISPKKRHVQKITGSICTPKGPTALKGTRTHLYQIIYVPLRVYHTQFYLKEHNCTFISDILVTISSQFW